ncbi:hypothetical protein PWT90_00478 [Aphanocladium album]|nr:hypothetical protein PWT90_00478 [Aphanocladium album]
MASELSPKALRRLGPMELYSSSRHSLGIYRAVTVSARYAPSTRVPNGPVTALSPRFFAALAAVVRAHPMLRVGITGEEGSKARYVHLPTMDLRDHAVVEAVHCANEDALNEEVSRVQAKTHDQLWEHTESKSPWRLTIVRDADMDCEDVILSYHHSLFDGTSGREFHESLLRALQSAADDGEPILTFPDAPVLPEPQEEAIKFTLGPLYVASMLWGQFGPTMLKPAPQEVWGGHKVSFSLPYITRIRAVDILPSQTKLLLTACRQQKTTITGLFHALAFAYFTQALSADAVPGFSCASSMSCRSHLRADIDASLRRSLRVLTTTMSHDLSLSDVARMRAAQTSNSDALTSCIWTYAARIRGELAERSKTLPHNNVAGVMKHISDWHQFHTSRDGKPRASSWEVSNIGVLDGVQEKVRVSRVMFSNSAIVTGAAVCLNAASAPDGHLNVAISWQEAVAEGLGKALKEMVDKFCETKMWTL